MSCNSTTISNSTSGFPNAATMLQLATNYPVIWEEICMIQQAVLAASSQCQSGGGQMCTTVGGTTPMTFVSGVTSVTVVNGGSGYFRDSPAVHFIPPVGVTPGIIATGTVTTNGGNIIVINITNGGLGYQPVPATMSVSSFAGFGAILQPLVDGSGGIVNVNIANAGSGYTVNDTVTATRAVLPNIAYVDAVFKITSVSITGQIVEIAILNPGSGYQDSVTEAQIVSTLNPLLPYPMGTGFLGTVLTDPFGTITQVVIDNTGAGYAVDSPNMVITDPGTGATTVVTLSGTSVASIAVTAPGTNYTQTATGTVFNPPTAALPNPPVTQAVVTINVADNTFGTIPSLYWQVWAGTVTNKAIQQQLNAVLSYFTALGYTISIISNSSTGNTILWKICW
jgi:hypothetical protein